MDEIRFAEIEIGSTAERPAQGETAVQFSGVSGIAAQTERLPERELDPVREKFQEMRRLSSQRPFARNEAELFYRQAKFMEDFTDDYSEKLGINMYYPCYQNMGYENLRTYFTWRTKARSGELTPTSTSYIFLYIYELLSGVGANDPLDGLDKLLSVWDTYSADNPAIVKYLPMWFKDYFIFYELPYSFFEFVEIHGLGKYYGVTLLLRGNAEKRTQLLRDISGYDVSKSKFIGDGNEELFSGCLRAVLDAIDEFCRQKNLCFEDLIVYSTSKKAVWMPFKNALFGSNATQADREVQMSKYEQYHCKNGVWSATLPIYFSTQKDFVGYIVKKTESALRNAARYKYKLVAEIKSGSRGFMELSRMSAKKAKLDKIIERTTLHFYKESTRTVVVVNHKNLSRIREEALETQEQLIVGDDGNRPTNDDYLQTSQPTSITANLPESEPEIGWQSLKSALSQTELKALSIALQDSENV
ncbi:MAG: TerB N-terminal domain-containing protein, partial [Oscillospiraceae bacterium]|nr:TerB N-terminal domain-containing protein [Oscillospiraceae bacterium]